MHIATYSRPEAIRKREVKRHMKDLEKDWRSFGGRVGDVDTMFICSDICAECETDARLMNPSRQHKQLGEKTNLPATKKAELSLPRGGLALMGAK